MQGTILILGTENAIDGIGVRFPRIPTSLTGWLKNHPRCPRIKKL
jgi:hypothetical protein